MTELIEVDNADVVFTTRRRGQLQHVQAVTGATFGLRKGEVLGLVGESGSGKSTLGLAIIGLQAVTGGAVRIDNAPMPAEGTLAWRKLRRRLQIVYQDPFSALNPRWTIRQCLFEPLRLHGILPRENWDERVGALLSDVGLPAEVAGQYPGALSGGQRQRVCIARALAVEPEVIVCDEITSALDVSTQAQIVALLRQLQKKTGVGLLFISHDLGLVRAVADRSAVMYLGRIVEFGPSDEIFDAPKHPYTRALLDAAPVPDPVAEKTRRHQPLEGEIPDPSDPPSGCRFRTRCSFAEARCAEVVPPLDPVGQTSVACHFWERIAQSQTAGPSK